MDELFNELRTWTTDTALMRAYQARGDLFAAARQQGQAVIVSGEIMLETIDDIFRARGLSERWIAYRDERFARDHRADIASAPKLIHRPRGAIERIAVLSGHNLGLGPCGPAQRRTRDLMLLSLYASAPRSYEARRTATMLEAMQDAIEATTRGAERPRAPLEVQRYNA